MTSESCLQCKAKGAEHFPDCLCSCHSPKIDRVVNKLKKEIDRPSKQSNKEASQAAKEIQLP